MTNQHIGLLKRCFESLVLENASPAWNPYYQKDINKLETKTQKRALRRSRLAAKCVSLEQRRREAGL